MITSSENSPAPSDPVLQCPLVGGPAEGTKKTEWSGAQRVVVPMTTLRGQDLQTGWAIYRRSDPEVRLANGVTEIHFYSFRT